MDEEIQPPETGPNIASHYGETDHYRWVEAVTIRAHLLCTFSRVWVWLFLRMPRILSDINTPLLALIILWANKGLVAKVCADEISKQKQWKGFNFPLFRETWRRVRDTEGVPGVVPHSTTTSVVAESPAGSSESNWPSQQAPALASGFSSFVWWFHSHILHNIPSPHFKELCRYIEELYSPLALICDIRCAFPSPSPLFFTIRIPVDAFYIL